jgi:tRNA (guanine26-N2/guanine27-N2)-dimethyltransferase
MLNSSGFDYIDIDPFGSPNAFLDSAIRRISREGILAVTATDTAALTGTYIKPCKRKYWAVPLRSYMMHEIGLRILIRKIQLIGSQYDKALIPIFSYYCEHYFRVFLRCEKSKEAVDEVIAQHGNFQDAGPMWLGKLWDEKLVDCIEKAGKFSENNRVLRIIKEESKIQTVGFYDVTELASKYKLKVLPKLKDLVENIRKKGYLASETHFRENSIRSNISEKELVKMLNRKA